MSEKKQLICLGFVHDAHRRLIAAKSSFEPVNLSHDTVNTFDDQFWNSNETERILINFPLVPPEVIFSLVERSSSQATVVRILFLILCLDEINQISKLELPAHVSIATRTWPLDLKDWEEMWAWLDA